MAEPLRRRPPEDLLRASFIHLPQIGPRREALLWASGLDTWRGLSLARNPGPRVTQEGRQLLGESERALAAGNADWFADRFPRSEHWRLATAFSDDLLFLDIETTGLSLFYDTVTLVGWSIGNEYQVLVAREDWAPLREALGQARALVTFNGTRFDVPFLRRAYDGIPIPRVHVDLRYAVFPLGVRGRQKEVEVQLGHRRSAAIRDVSGADAVDLWFRYQRGDRRSLRQLIEYNRADVEGMKRIMACVVAHRVAQPAFHHASPAVVSIVKQQGRRWSASMVRRRQRIAPWEETIGPRMTRGALQGDGCRPLRRVAGIDLSGSENRTSGWALLSEAEVVTARLSTDTEIVRRTLEARPDIVSIDAPLSLPKGRRTVSDDDPARLLFGITRECEKILRRRGVSVYPALIQSMQSLTQRGMRLAKLLRERGIPVIESFPGAMQDILGIPRKKTSMEWLRTGLVEYGLHLASGVATSHDELDAVSAAVVGELAWIGYAERLGNIDEDFLVIPSLVPERRPEILVALSGLPASGKTYLARLLRRHGFMALSTSQLLAELLGVAPAWADRLTLQRLGLEASKGSSQRQLFLTLAQRATQSGSRVVIDAMRLPVDRAALLEYFGSAFVHVHVEAPTEVRRDRYRYRGGQDFDHATEHPIEASAPKLKRLADAVVNTNKSRRALLSEVLGAISSTLNLGD